MNCRVRVSLFRPAAAVILALSVALARGQTPGDVNGDGAVNATDTILVVHHLTGTAPLADPSRADANGDGNVDVGDVVWTANNPRGETITIYLPGDVPLELVRIPAGSFQMGRCPGEQDSSSNEDPQHAVTIGYDFYMGKYEVTKAQWEAVMGTTPWWGKLYVLGNPDCPAVYVSWDNIAGAAGFMETLNTHLTNTGQGSITVRLPSESEWECACRTRTATRFYWGDDPSYTQIDACAWHWGNTWEANEKYAHVVGLKAPNAFGLHDMSGNVWEWCQDDYHEKYTGAPADGSPWGDGTASYRVRRGGGWYGGAWHCRSAARYDSWPGYRDIDVGFRLGGRASAP